MGYYWRNVDHYKLKVNTFLGNAKRKGQGTREVGQGKWDKGSGTIFIYRPTSLVPFSPKYVCTTPVYEIFPGE